MGHKVVTVIEIVSPSNKQPGPDRRSYETKQQEVLSSDANLIELDLLRTGRRLLPVSYTHLDVYKRQAVDHPREPAAGGAWRRLRSTF